MPHAPLSRAHGLYPLLGSRPDSFSLDSGCHRVRSELVGASGYVTAAEDAAPPAGIGLGAKAKARQRNRQSLARGAGRVQVLVKGQHGLQQGGATPRARDRPAFPVTKSQARPC